MGDRSLTTHSYLRVKSVFPTGKFPTSLPPGMTDVVKDTESEKESMVIRHTNVTQKGSL